MNGYHKFNLLNIPIKLNDLKLFLIYPQIKWVK